MALTELLIARELELCGKERLRADMAVFDLFVFSIFKNVIRDGYAFLRVLSLKLHDGISLLVATWRTSLVTRGSVMVYKNAIRAAVGNRKRRSRV